MLLLAEGEGLAVELGLDDAVSVGDAVPVAEAVELALDCVADPFGVLVNMLGMALKNSQPKNQITAMASRTRPKIFALLRFGGSWVVLAAAVEPTGAPYDGDVLPVVPVGGTVFLTRVVDVATGVAGGTTGVVGVGDVAA